MIEKITKYGKFVHVIITVDESTTSEELEMMAEQIINAADEGVIVDGELPSWARKVLARSFEKGVKWYIFRCGKKNMDE